MAWSGDLVGVGWAAASAEEQKVTSSLSLSACRTQDIHNEDGHLSCDWNEAPPPRVGRLVDSRATSASTSASTCRVLDHITFHAPQYKTPGDPIARLPSLSLARLRNHSGGLLANLSGPWTSFAKDGTSFVAQDDRFIFREYPDQLPPPPGLRQFEVVCSSAGDYESCSPQGGGGLVSSRWHRANATLNMSARTLRVQFSYGTGRRLGGVLLGRLDPDFLSLWWQLDSGMTNALWSRQSGTDATDCCTACTHHAECLAWTLDQRQHECLLASSTSTAYPSTELSGGYPISSDPAAYCEEKFIADPALGAWQDNDLPRGIALAALPPHGNGSNVSDFPRWWQSRTPAGDWHGGGARGTAWFFFPNGEDGPGARKLLDGFWSEHSGVGPPGPPPCRPPAICPHPVPPPGPPCFPPAICPHRHRPPPATPVYQIWTESGGVRVLCVDGGTAGTCDPVSTNGSAWHLASGTISGGNQLQLIFDSSTQLRKSGKLNAGLSVIDWADGSRWERAAGNCSCIPKDDPNCNQAQCSGARMSAPLARAAISGKPWIVFFHGGAFKYFSAISGNYYAPAARIARRTGMGVISVDYRTTDAIPNPAVFPEDLRDVLQAMQWLKAANASEIFVFGDSSGGTQVVQLLLWMEYNRQNGRDPGVDVAAAVSFSGWLDMTASGPTYETRRWLGGDGTGMGDAFFRDDPGLSRLHAMCAADVYADRLPINHPLISPLAAPAVLLAALPPLALFVGGAEQLSGGNFAFAQRAQSAGASVQVEVYPNMWHDFEMSSEGCGADQELGEGLSAYKIASAFLRNRGGGCQVQCKEQATCEGVAPVRWHMHYNALPPVNQLADCPGSYT